VLEQQREWLAEQLASHPLLQGKFSPESNGFSTASNGFSVTVETMPLYAAYRALQKSGGNFYDVHDAVRLRITFDGEFLRYCYYCVRYCFTSLYRLGQLQ
jgi:hypothetical protein